MIKKIIPSTLALVISSLSYAGTMGPVVIADFKPKESFYAGVGFGGSFKSDTEKDIYVINNNATQKTSSTSLAVGSVYIGYGHTWLDKYYLGIEANTYFPGHTATITTPGVTDVGLSFIDIEINQQATDTANPLSLYQSGHNLGGRFGAGIAHGFTENIGVAVDYFYTYYPTWGSYFQAFNLQKQMITHQNYVGISLIYTS